LNLLKTGDIGLECLKQPEIALTWFPKILPNLFRQVAALFMGWALTAPYR
jgi:hypothetical protein